MKELRPVSIQRCGTCGETGLFYAYEPSTGRILRALLLVAPLAVAAVWCVLRASFESIEDPAHNYAGLWVMGSIALIIAPLAVYIGLLQSGGEAETTRRCGRCGAVYSMPKPS